MKKILLALTTLIVSACSSTSYTTQTSENAYLQLTGNYTGSTIVVGEVQFEVTETTESFELNGIEVVKFEIATGKSELVVSKNNNIIIKKYIFTNEGQTVEVYVP